MTRVRTLAFLFALCVHTTAVAQSYTPPSAFPSDAAYDSVICMDPGAVPSQDSCSDEARDYRNIIGGTPETPAYLYANDGTYLYLRMRVEDDAREDDALVSFTWAFGIDNNGNGEFEAHVSLVGEGVTDRLEVRDQDTSNGTTPDLVLPSGGGTDTSLRAILTDGTGATWATVSPAPSVRPMQSNFCLDDPDTGDWYVTAAVPLAVLEDFGALGSAIAYGGSSSAPSLIQNDFVCADGNPPSCTAANECVSAVCLTDIGRCGPRIVPFFAGCVDDTAHMLDMGCTDATPHCIADEYGARCVACTDDSNCDDTNDCTIDECESNTCSHAALPVGDACAGGICNGSSASPVCVACVDNAIGSLLDLGCTSETPVCITSEGGPRCVACASASDCDDGNACTTEQCTSNVCSNAPVTAGTACATGVCDGNASTPSCVSCIDDASDTMRDSGCTLGSPVCDTSGAIPSCVGCTTPAHCNDSNQCTNDTCNAGTCSHSPMASGASCSGGVCNGSSSKPSCVICIDDSGAGEVDRGCSAAAPLCDLSGASPRCVACLTAADCNDGNSCTIDRCSSGQCVQDPEPTGTRCTGGVCNGSASAPLCLPCLDNKSGAGLDKGCTVAKPLCDTSGDEPVCVACVDDVVGGGVDVGCRSGAPRCDTSSATPRCVQCAIHAHCDDRNACTVDACASGSCTNATVDTGTACAGGVCDSGGANAVCVECIDDVVGSGRDTGCPVGAPACDDSGASPHCTGCANDDDCDDRNDCTTDTCASGVCSREPVPIGATCDDGVCNGDTAAPTCVVCIDDVGGTGEDSGCFSDAPVCVTHDGTSTCVECAAHGQCDDASECTIDVCRSGACTSTPRFAGAICTTGICDGEASSSRCVPCIDDRPGATRDTGCIPTAPLCERSGDTARCAPCIDGGEEVIDVGCIGPNEVCDADEDPAVCVACEDTERGAELDFGCEIASPFCEVVAGRPSCVQCRKDEECPEGLRCNDVTHRCAASCDSTDDCAVPTPFCNLDKDICVECLRDNDCRDGEQCTEGNVCSAPDDDGDGIDDVVDMDDDNDGLHDITESDGDNDFDLDGILNRVDLDSDGDGLTDLREGGGIDVDGNGIVDVFRDRDGNGLEDSVMVRPLLVPNSDALDGPDFLDRDSDDDHVLDIFEAGGRDANDDGWVDEAADNDGDGLNDLVDPDNGGNALPGPDTDGDGVPDWRDPDDDGDGLTTLMEDVDRDGDPRNDDTDGDGIPDYLDAISGGTPNDSSGGGCSCSASPRSGRNVYALLLLVLLFLRMRRRIGSRGMKDAGSDARDNDSVSAAPEFAMESGSTGGAVRPRRMRG